MNYKNLNFYIADQIEPEKNSNNWIKAREGKSVVHTINTVLTGTYSSHYNAATTYNINHSNTVAAHRDYPLAPLIQVPYEKYINFLHIQSLLPNTKGNGWISTTISKDQLIPMLDVDNNVTQCVEHLKDICKIPFTAFVSSVGNHGWIFLDKIRDYAECESLVQRMKYSDHKYLRCTASRKEFIVRGHFKHNGIPQQIYTSNDASPQFVDWSNAFTSFWSCDDMKDILSNYFIEAL